MTGQLAGGLALDGGELVSAEAPRPAGVEALRELARNARQLGFQLLLLTEAPSASATAATAD